MEHDHPHRSQKIGESRALGDGHAMRCHDGVGVFAQVFLFLISSLVLLALRVPFTDFSLVNPHVLELFLGSPLIV